MYSFLADMIAAVHLGYVSFVVVGQVLIMLGMILKWQWIRSPVFRIVHLVMICVVALEALVRFECPLTTWEGHFRHLAGQDVAGTFIGRCLHALLFPDWPDEAFTPVYFGFAALVILTFVLAPPRRRRTA
jgi:hypothetical protein